MTTHFRPVEGTRVGVHQTRLSEDPVPCIRCGHPRQRTHSVKRPSGLCRDCRYSMSTEEVEIWSRSTEAA